VPTEVAQFYRGRVEPEPPLTEFQPVVFSTFQEEHMIMSMGLTFVLEKDMEHTMCFSERMWKNMLNGRPPQGGKPMLKRDPTVWPTMDEIIFLTNTQRNKKTDGFDYLCVAAPMTISIGGQFKEVTGSFTLPFRRANELTRQLSREMKRILLRWVCEEMFVCDRRGIRRDLTACIDHFFYHYQMCLGTNGTDRDSMRRKAIRWLIDTKMIPTKIDEDEVTFNWERESNKRDNLDSIISDVKEGVKKSKKNEKSGCLVVGGENGTAKR
jgi:hypothetical protein